MAASSSDHSQRRSPNQNRKLPIRGWVPEPNSTSRVPNARTVSVRHNRLGLRDEEFNRAREQILAAQDMSLQNNSDLAQSCALNELYGLGYRYQFEASERLRRLTPADVQRAAADLFHPDRRATSVVLPATTSQPESAHE